MKRRGKFKMIVLIVVVVILLGLGAAIIFTAGERKEGRNLPIAIIDFNKLKDGKYIGEYAGGMKKLRANKVQVTVSSGKVTEIELLEAKNKPSNKLMEELYGRVIKAQTLQVDTISGATITSKALLKSVEDALLKAQIN